MEPSLNHGSKSSHLLRAFGIIMILLETLSILPLLLIAHYNHPSADDYYYGILTAHAWFDTGSIMETLKAALITVKETYLNWQGSFSGIFVMALQPSIFGENWYPVGTYIILASYLTGFLFLGKTLFNRFLSNRKNYYLLICFSLFVFSIQLAPFPRQGYYWFNGSAYYTFFHGLALVLFALVLRMQMTVRRSKLVLLLIPSISLALIIGGCNYVTALQSALLLFFFSTYLITSRSKNKVPVSMVFIALVLSLGISILAPGNAVRQAMIPGHPSIAKAILLSFFWAGLYLCKWSSLYLVGVSLVLMPFIIDTVRYSTFTFQKPWLVAIASFLMLTVSFAPPIYGLGKPPERVLNIIFYLFILLSSINIIYFSGWFMKQKIQIFSKDFEQRMNRKLLNSSLFFFILGGIILIAAFVQEPDIAVKEATQSLITGEAIQYDSEASTRLKIYLDKKIKNVVVKEYSVKPSLLFNNDIGTDVKDWQNESVAAFYRKDRVVIE